VLGQKIPWPVALGMIFWAGVFFLLISVTPVRERIAQAIPVQIRTAAAAGIGLFLTFIGLKNLGLVVADPATFVRLGHVGWPQLCGLAGMAFMIFFTQRKNPLAFLGGMVLATVLGLAVGLVQPPAQILSRPDFGSVFLKLDPLGALRLAYVPAILSILFTDLFDSLSTFVGVAHATGLTDRKGEAKNLREGLIVDALATFGASLLGTSSGTAFIESTAGIEMGGRTGLTSVFTALCFLPCLFLAPLAGAIPAFATAPVLILVGALMFRSVSGLKLQKLEDVVPAFLTITLIPLTFSITQGILWGFIAHAGLYAMAGRRREVAPTMWGLAALAVVLIWVER
jgi:AGZA family xanthine/uracil permease-like MFS transporter